MDEMEIHIISFTYQWSISGQPEVETSQTTHNILFRAIKLTLFSPAKKLYFFHSALAILVQLALKKGYRAG